MADNFTAADWNHLQERASTLTGQLQAKGVTVEPFNPMPPIPRSQVDDFEEQTGLRLPQDFVDLVTQFAGGWRFYWNLEVQADRRWLRPPAYMGDFGGNSEVPFIGASEGCPLLKLYNTFQEEIRDDAPDDPDTLAALSAMFPLHLTDGGGGDYTVLRLDTSPVEVVYLDHESRRRLGDNRILGHGLSAFLRRWANLSFPQCEYHHSWVDASRREPDDESLRAQEWGAWLSNPSAA
ncbi:MAG: SMI1/KNR4 family protein [Armatimonadota bacterium]|nr:SMI1/KNR4 family protein [Armatimonadota bacterium]